MWPQRDVNNNSCILDFVEKKLWGLVLRDAHRKNSAFSGQRTIFCIYYVMK